MTRKNYSREYKREAVQLVTARGVSIAQAARNLDSHVTVLRRWVHELGSSGSDAFPGKGQMKPEDEEVGNLRREVAKLKAERDILKKGEPWYATGSRSRHWSAIGSSPMTTASAYFARDQL